MASFSLCGNLNIEKCSCFFRCSKKQQEDEVLYLQQQSNISIISHAKKEHFTTLLPTEIYTKLLFSPDEKVESCPIDYCLFGVTPTDYIYIMCQQGNVFQSHMNENKSLFLHERYSQHVLRFLEPIYQKTLKGKSLQVQLNIDSTSYLLQTFPIVAPHNRKLILAGLCVTSPHNENIDINRLIVNNSTMRSHHVNDQKDNHLSTEHTTTEYDVEHEDCLTEPDAETEPEDYNKLNGDNHSGILI